MSTLSPHGAAREGPRPPGAAAPPEGRGASRQEPVPASRGPAWQGQAPAASADPSPVAAASARARSPSGVPSAPVPSASRHALPSRQGAPPVAPTRRGSKGLAIATASDPDRFRDACVAYERDKDARGVQAARSSYLNTWSELHAAYFAALADSSGVAPDVFPLAPASVDGVATLLKAGRYRACEEYMAKAKDEHIALGWPWTDLLTRAQRRAVRSVTRGIGPAKQAGALDLPALQRVELNTEPIVPGGPMGPGRLVAAGSFFMLREVEAALAMRQHLTFDSDRLEVTWLLPCTKTDPRALGRHRTWGCVCKNSDFAEPGLCPYHVLLDQDTARPVWRPTRRSIIPHGRRRCCP